VVSYPRPVLTTPANNNERVDHCFTCKRTRSEHAVGKWCQRTEKACFQCGRAKKDHNNGRWCAKPDAVKQDHVDQQKRRADQRSSEKFQQLNSLTGLSAQQAIDAIPAQLKDKDDFVAIDIDGADEEEVVDVVEAKLPPPPAPLIVLPSNDREYHYCRQDGDKPYTLQAHRFDPKVFIARFIVYLFLHWAVEVVVSLFIDLSPFFPSFSFHLYFKLVSIAITLTSAFFWAWKHSWSVMPVHIISVMKLLRPVHYNAGDRRSDIQSLMKLKHSDPIHWLVHRCSFLAMRRYGAPDTPYFRNSPFWALHHLDIRQVTHSKVVFEGYVIDVSKEYVTDSDMVVSLQQTAQIGQLVSVGGLPRADALRKINIWARTPSSVISDRFMLFNVDRQQDAMENARVLAHHILMDYLDSRQDLQEGF